MQYKGKFRAGNDLTSSHRGRGIDVEAEWKVLKGKKVNDEDEVTVQGEVKAKVEANVEEGVDSEYHSEGR